MAGSDLHIAMDILSSAALEEQGRLLRVEPLLSDLRIAVLAVSVLEETPDGIIKLTHDERVGSASARLREVLEVVLAGQRRVEACCQVSVTLSSKNPLFRRTITRDLKSLLSDFTTIKSSVVTLEHDSVEGGRVSEHGVTIQSNSNGEQQVVLEPKARNPTVVNKNSLAKMKVVEKMLRILLVGRVSDDGPLFLPLVGGPGSGKTLFAQTLFNDARVMDRFDVRVWVHVSQRFDLSEILWRILNASHARVYIEDDQAVLKSHVHEALSDRRYLIVLDDVWSENAQEWRALMQALPSNGTLILTSRIPAVVSCVATIKPHPSKTLEEKLHSQFVHLWAANANEIQYAAINQQLESEREEFILQSAHASYFHLPLDLRKCLLYCSIFPLGYEFDPEELADLLAAEGRISPTMTQAQRTTCLQKLFDECFHPVEESGNATRKRKYRMDIMLHEFAQLVDRQFSRFIDHGFKDFIDHGIKDFGDSVQRVSLYSTEYLYALRECKNLRTVILLGERMRMGPFNDSSNITEFFPLFFQSSRHLSVLNLQASDISTLPRKFDTLSNLRYLNLSRTDINKIPDFVSKLQFLQTLILSHCEKLQELHGTTSKLVQLQKLDLEGCYYLLELPPNMSKMKSLQYLNVHECSSLTRMPYSMGKLMNLQTMLGYVVPDNDGRAISELQPLANLKKLSLESLENISDVEDARDVKLQDKQELESLAFKWNKSADNNNSRVAQVLEWLRPNPCLKTLEIVAYEGNDLPSWMTSSDPYLTSLVEIRLVNLKFCETLPPLGLLPVLKIVEISGAEVISSIGDGFYGSSGTFPTLEKLIFSYMSNLEFWEQPHRGPVFPCLAELTVIQCPKLALHVELPSVPKLILWMNNKTLHSSKGALGNMAHSLKHVSISFCQELTASSDCEGLQDLRRLKGLELCGCDEMKYLPRGLQHLSSLRSLTIVRCNKLKTLPDWLENLSSLHLLRLSACPMLHSIPEGLRQRHCTQISIEDCPKLSAHSSETAWERYDDDDDDELFADIISDDFGDEESVVHETLSENFGDSKSTMRDTLLKDFGDSEPATEIASDLVQPDLYSTVMNIPGFTEEQLLCAFSHLSDNEAQGKVFVDMPELRRISWIGKFLAKHFQP